MGRDFFDELGDSISKKTRDLGKMAGQFYETQKIRSKVSSEEHMIAKLKADIGNYIYEKYQNGEKVEDALKGFCEEIRQHLEIIDGYRDSAAELKGQKICRSCGNSVDRSVSYCPYCGSPCPTPEPKEEPVAESQAVQHPAEDTMSPEEMRTEPVQAAKEQEEPAKVQEESAEAQEEPAKAQEELAETQEEPATAYTEKAYAPEREASETEN